MACRSCAERRRIVSEAMKRDGLKGMVRAATLVGRHLMQNPPLREKEEDGPDGETAPVR